MGKLNRPEGGAKEHEDERGWAINATMGVGTNSSNLPYHLLHCHTQQEHALWLWIYDIIRWYDVFAPHEWYKPI